MNSGQKNALLIISIFLGVVILFRYLHVEEYLTIGKIKENICGLQYYSQEYCLPFSVAYLFVYTAAIACTLPVVLPFTLLGGLLLGVFRAVIYSVISVTIGSIITFMSVRYVFRATVQKKYRWQLQRFNERIHDHGAGAYLILLHFMTIIPFFVINSLAALAEVSFGTFIWTSAVGSLPIIFVYALAGRQLCSISSMRDIFSPTMILLLVCLIGVALLIIGARRFQKNL